MVLLPSWLKMKNRLKICSCGKRIPDTESCDCKRAKKRDYQREYQRKDKNNPLKTARWNKLRKEILKRDGHLCQRCLHKYGLLNASELQGHHIKSRKDFPELVFDKRNVITLCKTCNLQLGTSNKLDFNYEVPENETNYNFL